MPIDAILFGGRRAIGGAAGAPRRSTGSTACSSARSWARRRPPPQAGEVGELRFDPMAMLPFCGYNMGDYFAHWLEIGRARGRRAARSSSMVNWFRKDDDGTFLWPGFGENSRVLAWVFRRCDDDAEAVETPIGRLPRRGRRSTPRGSTSQPRTLAELLRGRPGGLGGRAAAGARALRHSSATGCRRRSAASSLDWRTRSADGGRPGGPAVLHRARGTRSSTGMRCWPSATATSRRRCRGPGRRATPSTSRTARSGRRTSSWLATRSRTRSSACRRSSRRSCGSSASSCRRRWRASSPSTTGTAASGRRCRSSGQR